MERPSNFLTVHTLVYPISRSCNDSDVRNKRLHHAPLTAIPEWISECECLQTLDLSNNKIDSIPEDFVFPSTLKELDLSNNLLTEVPKGLPESLNKLTLNYNNISSLDGVVLPSKLSMFSAINNNINEISDEVKLPKSLKTFDIGHKEDTPTTRSDTGVTTVVDGFLQPLDGITRTNNAFNNKYKTMEYLHSTMVKPGIPVADDVPNTRIPVDLSRITAESYCSYENGITTLNIDTTDTVNTKELMGDYCAHSDKQYPHG